MKNSLSRRMHAYMVANGVLRTMFASGMDANIVGADFGLVIQIGRFYTDKKEAQFMHPDFVQISRCSVPFS